MSKDSLNGHINGGTGNSRRKRENVIVSSRSGSNVDEGLDSPRHFTDSPNHNHPEEANDRIVLLKINMDSGNAAVN